MIAAEAKKGKCKPPDPFIWSRRQAHAGNRNQEECDDQTSLHPIGEEESQTDRR